MVLGRTETIETLGILGGIGAVFGPIIPFGIYYVNFWSFFFLAFGYLNLFAFLVGIIACALSLSAVGKVKIRPQQSVRDLQAAGILELIAGFICIFNWLIFVSAILILVAYNENDQLWRKIKFARQQTGFPYITVATAAGNIWNRRLSCRFCGAPLVVMAASSRGPQVRVKGVCPLDNTTDVIRLPLALLEEWAPTLADRLHRCQYCGERTAAQVITHQTYRTTRLRAYCPQNHPNRTYRYIWTPLYPHITNSPEIDVGFRSGGYQPRFYPSTGVGITQLRPFPQTVAYTTATQHGATSPRSLALSAQPEMLIQREGPITFCMQCGVRVEPMDRFCFSCGRRIR